MIGFTVASMLCGIAGTLPEMVGFRLLQGVFGAALVPLSQTTMLNIYPPEKRGSAMAIWGMGSNTTRSRSRRRRLRIATGPIRPLAKERWAGGIDAVGSTTLANVLSMTGYGGVVAACGLAGGMDLPTSVAPFILRGVSLLGIDSVMCPLPLRQEAWRRLATDLDRSKIAAMTSEIGLADVIAAGQRIVEGRVRGRIVVKIG